MAESSAVKFLRKCAEERGGLGTISGQAMHRAAGNMTKLEEELGRVEVIVLGGDHMARREAAAEAIFLVMRARSLQQGAPAHSVPPTWDAIRAAPLADVYRACAAAALGLPMLAPSPDAEVAAGLPAVATTTGGEGASQ